MQEEAQRAKNEAKAGETKAEEGASVQPSEYSATAKQVIRACSSLFNNGGLEELTAPFSEVASVPRKALIKLNFLHLWWKRTAKALEGGMRIFPNACVQNCLHLRFYFIFCLWSGLIAAGQKWNLQHKLLVFTFFSLLEIF